jgi:hypothetical protein
MGGGFATSGTAPLGSLGMFIGPKSSSWNKAAAQKAVEMEKAGARPIEIWRETMTARGLDNKWRQEIPDVGAVLNMEKVPRTAILNIEEVLRERGITVDPKKTLNEQLGPALYDEIYAEARARQKAKPTDTRLTNAFEHPVLEEAYPNLVNNLRLARENSIYARGRFDPTKKLVTTGGGDMFPASPEAKLAQERSTLLHEIQHAIQHAEDFGRGGNPTSAREIASAQIRAEVAPLVEPFTQNRHYWEEYGRASRNEYMLRLSDIANRQNIKPRTIYNLSDWYQFGDDYRLQAGPQPKKPGPDRDKWFQDAAEYIRMRKFNTDSRYANLPYDNIKDAKNAQRRAMTQIKKTGEAAQKYTELGQKKKRLGELTDEEVYMRLAGEAESRLTQRRENLSMEERRANFPFAERFEKKTESWNTPVEYGNPFGLDVPPKEVISYTQFGSSYGRQDPLMRFLGTTEPAGDPLERFVGLQGK